MKFSIITLIICSLAGLLIQQKSQTKPIDGKIHGSNIKVGHLLHSDLPSANSFENKDIVIIGAGISGLTAAWKLSDHGIHSYTILELEEELGGNARSRYQQHQKTPIAAHYLPVPEVSNSELISFLEKIGVITGFSENLPIYNEENLCFLPKERLLLNNLWQRGIVPAKGLSTEHHKEAKRFFALMDHWRKAKGLDGKDIFKIPTAHASQKHPYQSLHQKTFADYLKEQGFLSPYLLWYCDYCCRDDFGADSSQVSAYTGIRYFAARKGKGANTLEDPVLTWPQGNHFLVEKALESIKGEIRTSNLVFKVEKFQSGFKVHTYDHQSKKTSGFYAKHVVFAAPQFTAPYIIDGLEEWRIQAIKELEYACWLVANIDLKDPPYSFQPSWENVAYNGKSLGYVNNNHQKLQAYSPQQTLTLYWPIDHLPPAEARKFLFQKSITDLQNMVLDELKILNPEIIPYIDRIDYARLGHAMVIPKILKENQQRLHTPFHDLLFAHSDLSINPIFEEAFHHGIQAALEIIRRKDHA